MRAVRFDGQRIILDPGAPEPAPGPGEALVRPTRIALTHDTPTQPITLGRQFVGVVMQANVSPGSPLGSDQKFKQLKGRRVVGSASIACRVCDLCKGGLSHHCRSRQVLGQTRNGCLAELFTIPLANLHAVPDSIDDDRATFVQSLAAAVHASQMVRLEGKTYISVLGDSPQALLIAQVMAKLNASVRVLGTRPALLDLCERWGVKHRPLGDVGQRHDQDVVVECTGSTVGLTIAMGLVRPRGRIILPVAPPLAMFDLAPLVSGELEVLGCRDGSIEPALDLLAKHQIQVEPLIARRVKLEAAPKLLSEPGVPGTGDGLSVLVEF